MPKFWNKVLAVLTIMQLVLSGVPSVFADQSMIKVMDTTAGQPAFIVLSGQPNEVVPLTITNPFHSVITQQYQLNDQGLLQYWYPQTIMAGEYILDYKGQISSFTVQPAAPDTKKSQIDLSDYTAFVGASITGKITLKDGYGNLVNNRLLELKTKGVTHLSCSNGCRTNQQGLVQFSISSEQTGMKTLSVIDTQTSSILFQEDLGFIPSIQVPFQSSFTNTSNSPFIVTPTDVFNSGYQSNPVSTGNQLDFIPILDPTKATLNAQGNDDRFLSNGIESHFQSYLPAQLLDPNAGSSTSSPDSSSSSTTSNTPSSSTATSSTSAPTTSTSSTSTTSSTTSTVATTSGSATGFQIILGVDKTASYKDSVDVEANKALDFILRAVDAQGNLVKDYTGDVKFTLDPAGPPIPADYTMKSLDQGEAVFELAMVLPAGKYVFSLADKNNSNLKGVVNITARLQSAPPLNNTSILLKLDSPVSNSVYSKTFAVQGSTNTDNTEIVVKEGTTELKRGKVDDQKNYNFPLELPDGKHQLEITATYLVDGSQTKTTVDLEVDQTPPVITSVNVQSDPVRAGELFTITAVAEKDSIMKAFINNRSYDFIGLGTDYNLSANAPLDLGDFPVSIQIADKLGNSDTTNNAGVLKVVAPLAEIKNIFGIPGVSTMTLSWDPTPGAVTYEVLYKSVLGTSPQTLSTDKNRITIENLVPDVSYVFTVTAKDTAGKNLSLPSDSKALTVLPPATSPTVTPAQVVMQQTADLKPAADVQTLPARQTKSGPEVYLLILLSIVLLNVYGRVRKALVSIDE